MFFIVGVYKMISVLKYTAYVSLNSIRAIENTYIYHHLSAHLQPTCAYCECYDI